MCAEERPRKDTERRRPEVRAASAETNLPTPWLGASKLQNCETVRFCCLSHPGCGILLYGNSSKVIQYFISKGKRRNVSGRRECSTM